MILTIILAVLVLAVVLILCYAFLLWRNLQDAFPAAHTCITSKVNDVAFIDMPGIGLACIPPEASDGMGLVYLPGALVEHTAYAPLCSSIAHKSKCIVVLLKVPLRMSPFGGQKRIAAAMEAFPNITKWAVGGHSLGGATASQFVHSNPGKVQGIVFHAAYPQMDLRCQNHMHSLLVQAEFDGVITRKNVEAAPSKLPNVTREIVKGGNHAGFGYYGPQTFPKPDGVRSITLAQQQERVVDVTVSWLTNLDLAPANPEKHELSYSVASDDRKFGA